MHRAVLKAKQKTWALVASAAGFAALAAAWLVLPLKDWLFGFSEWSQGLGWLGIALFSLLYVVGTLLLVPGFPMTIALAFAYGWWAMAVSYVSGLIAALIAFLVARYWARSAAKRFVRRYPSLKALDSVTGDEGFQVVALLRLSPVAPFSPSNYAFGMSAVTLQSYMLGTAAGVIPGTILNVYLGVLGSTASAGKATSLTWVGLGLGLAATAALTVWIGRQAKARMQPR